MCPVFPKAILGPRGSPVRPTAPSQPQCSFSWETLWRSASFSSLRGESQMQRDVRHGFCHMALSLPLRPSSKILQGYGPLPPLWKPRRSLSPVSVRAPVSCTCACLSFKAHVPGGKGWCLHGHLLGKVSQVRDQWQSTAHIS